MVYISFEKLKVIYIFTMQVIFCFCFDLVFVGDVCIDVSSVYDSGYAWRLAWYVYQGMKKGLSAMSL